VKAALLDEPHHRFGSAPIFIGGDLRELLDVDSILQASLGFGERGSPHADTARPPTSAKRAPSSVSSADARAAASVTGSGARVAFVFFLAMGQVVQVHRAHATRATCRTARRSRPRRGKGSYDEGFSASSRPLRAASPWRGASGRRRSHEAWSTNLPPARSGDRRCAEMSAISNPA
jgi:hypothetical protein